MLIRNYCALEKQVESGKLKVENVGYFSSRNFNHIVLWTRIVY
ncbi:hypothetical protein [Oceanirhabdus sp. W0125-5]|nr:hypothetical protein [Oceanirhabdus sp. W0125-5]WBW98708.1 hypothetical protein OW730_08105 [Oceanirhabdus sp. W0125-5]